MRCSKFNVLEITDYFDKTPQYFQKVDAEKRDEHFDNYDDVQIETFTNNTDTSF